MFRLFLYRISELIDDVSLWKEIKKYFTNADRKTVTRHTQVQK